MLRILDLNSRRAEIPESRMDDEGSSGEPRAYSHFRRDVSELKKDTESIGTETHVGC